MSFNRRGGPDRRPDRFQRPDRDRGPRPEGGGDWQARDRGPGGPGGRPFPPRGDRPYPPRPGGDRPYQPRPGGDRPYQPRPGGDRPYQPRPQFDRAPDDGAMSIRLDPRRVTVLKRLAAESGARPGDLVRQWIEERLDAARQGIDTPDAAKQLTEQLAELAERVASLEAAAGLSAPIRAEAEPERQDEPAEDAIESEPDGPDAKPSVDADGRLEAVPDEDDVAEAAPRTRAKRVTAKPAGPRIALHDEMIAVLAERGPMAAADLATAVAERGRYQPPRSGKPLDAAMISQRVSNPVYRARFTRNEGRIGLAESAE